MEQPNSIEAHNLTVSYQRKPVLWNIDFVLPKGKIIGILGPNGSGKTTLLKSMLGLLPLDSGYVRFFDQPLSKSRNRVAYVPQRETVDWDFPTNVLEVVKMGRIPNKGLFTKISNHDPVVNQAIEAVGLKDFKDRQISQLSGGQQQRVFIARSLAQEADLYILDEPFTGVDMASEKAIMDLLQAMREEGKTIVVVHHDLQTAKKVFDWAILLNTRMVAAGPINEVLTPNNIESAYGGKLDGLSQVGDALKAAQFPVREKNKEDRDV